MAVSTMNVGDISDPLAVVSGATKGYHIVWLKDRVKEHTMNLNDDWKRVEQLATSYKSSNVYREWLKQLRTQIYWESRL